MARHHAWVWALLMLWSLCLARCARGADSPATRGSAQRPNILLAIADDWSFPHAGVYGDPVIKTPTFDRVANEGVLFSHAYCAAPSCSASRASILTGQWPHRLAEGADLWATLPARFAVYTDALEKAGYRVGYTRKGWGPGGLGDRTRNPAGPSFKSFDEFIATVPPGQPFCFWFGSHDPHRKYVEGSGRLSGMDPAHVIVPSYLPDTPEVRSDILDYYFAVQRYDRDTGHIVKLLEDSGRLDNTIGRDDQRQRLAFPASQGECLRMERAYAIGRALAARCKGGRTVDDLVSLIDLCPTFLQAAGVELRELPDMNGQSLYPILTGDESMTCPKPRPVVFFERERHANVRKGDLSYPSRHSDGSVSVHPQFCAMTSGPPVIRRCGKTSAHSAISTAAPPSPCCFAGAISRTWRASSIWPARNGHRKNCTI